MVLSLGFLRSCGGARLGYSVSHPLGKDCGPEVGEGNGKSLEVAL